MSAYEELLAAEQRTNQYDGLLAKDDENQKQRLAGSLSVGSQSDPNQRAEVIDLASRARVPTAVVERNIDSFRKPSVDYDAMIRDNPRLSEWLGNVENASIAHDDLPSLSTWEWMLKAPKTGWQQGSAMVELGQLGTKAMRQGLTDAEEKRVTELNDLSAAPTGADNFWSKAYVGSFKAAGPISYSILEGVKTGLPIGMTAGGAAAIAGQVGPLIALPEEIITVPVATWAGFRAGAVAGSYRASYELEGGNAFLEFRAIEDEDGNQIDPRVAAIAAEAVGTVSGAIELGGLGVLVRSFPGGKQVFQQFTRENVKEVLRRPTVIKALGQLAGRYGAVWSAEVAQEVSQEAVTIIAGEIAKSTDGGRYQMATREQIQERLLETAKQSAAEFAFISALGPGSQFIADASRSRRATERQKAFEAIASTESKLRERAPEKFREFVAKVTENGPVETIYIPAEQFVAYFQGQNIDPSQALAKMPEVAKQLDVALASGGDLAIPMADFATYIAPSEHYKGLSQDLRFGPEDMTLREATLWQERAEVLGKELEKAAKQEKPGLPDQAVFDDVREQLIGTGMEPGTAERNATLVASVFRSLGERTGESPKALYDRYGLKIQRGEAPTATQQEVERIVADDNLLTPVLEEIRAVSHGTIPPPQPEIPAAAAAQGELGIPTPEPISEPGTGQPAPRAEPELPIPERAVAGGTGQVRIGDQYRPVQWAVMEAADLAPTIDKAENQYRDRNRAAAQAQVAGIAAAIDFNLLGHSPLMDYGAPTLAPDARVIGGNGRIAAIRMAYARGGGDAYKRPLVAQAEQFGLSRADVEAMNEPVLVRVLPGDVDVKEAAIASNEGGALRMSALETAKVDAERLGPLQDFEVDESGQLSMAGSRNAIRRWVGAQPATQRGALVDAQGQLSAEGAQRIRNAMLYRAYGDSPTLSRLVESIDPGSRNVAAALLRVAPRMAELRDAIAQGERYPLDISEDVQTAVEKLNRIRESGQSIDEALGQGDIFGAQLSPEADAIARFLGKNLRSSKSMAEFMDRYLDLVDRAGSPKQGDLMGDRKAPDKLDLIERAAAAATPAKQIELASTGQLFQGAAVRPWQWYLDNWTPDQRLSPEQKQMEAEFMAWITEDPERAMAQYAAYRNSKGENETLGGKLLNTDLVRELWPGYRRDRSQSVAVHEPASALTKAMYAKRLLEEPEAGQERLVLFSAGGTGAGKTTGLRRFLSKDMDRAHVIYDTNMNGFASGNDKVQQAFAADHKVEIVYTYRDPLDALQNGALARAMRMELREGSGRALPVDEHLETHFGSNQAIFEFVAAYGDDERASFGFIINDMDYAKSRRVELSEVPVLDQMEYNNVREQALEIIEQERQEARISGTIAAAFLQSEIPARRRIAGRGDGGELEAQRLGRAEGRDTPAGIIGDAIRRAGLDIQTVTPEQVRAAVREAGALFQAAFHGSPYDFGRFDIGRIGTGEGAQAYGWGLYFAEDQEVADAYRVELAKRTISLPNGVEVGITPGTLPDEVVDYLMAANGDYKEAMRQVREDMIGLSGTHRLRTILRYLREWQKGGVVVKQGQLYRVEINDSHVEKMLDFDKPVSGQTKTVKDALAKELTGPIENDETLGRELYAALSEEFGGDRQASEFLRGIGITGIRYLDAYSRAPRVEWENSAAKDKYHRLSANIAHNYLDTFGSKEAAVDRLQRDAVTADGVRKGDGKQYADAALAIENGDLRILPQTANFVVFDDSIIEITHKNGKPVSKEQRAELLQSTLNGPRAATTFGPDRQFTISLFETADLSSLLHESGHFYLEVLRDIASRPDAPQQIRDDMESLLKWFGVEGGLEAWNRMSIEEHRPFHEQFARGFEAYLFEGKAPNVELQSLFARFRAWLVSIYRSIERLNVRLNPEIRGVFDRLVATDDEIRAANEAQNYVEIFTTPEAAGYTPTEFQAYRKAVERARLEAEEKLTKDVLSELTREQKAWWNEERAKIEAEVTAEAYQNPVYRALAFLQRGKNPDGTDLEGIDPVKLNRAALIDQYGKDFLKTLPRPYVYSAEGGVAPDVVAAMFGFDSGDSLIQALSGARPMREAIQAETAIRMKAKFGDALLDGSLVEKAMEAVHNDHRADLLAAEMKALRRLERQVGPALRARELSQARERKEARELVPDADERKLIRRAAEQAIAGRKVRDINPNTYRVAEAKAGRMAFEAAGRGEYQVAYLEKRKQLLNHELYRAAAAARADAEKIREFMREFEKPKKRAYLGKAGSDYLEQIDALLDRFDFRRLSNVAGERRLALAEWILEQQKDGREINLPGWLIDESKRMPFKELTYEQLTGVRDAVVNIDHLARLKNKLLARADQRAFDDAVSDIVGSIDGNHKRKDVPFEFAPTFKEKMATKTRRAIAEHTKMEFLFNWLDGERDLGPAWTALFKPLADAEAQEQAMQRDARTRLKEIFVDRYTAKERWAMYHRKTFMPEIGKSMNKATLLAVALNVGNTYNREVLLRGYKWSEPQLRALLSRLEDRDWETVQMVWDMIDAYWPEISKLQKDLTGLSPAKVEALPFQTPTRREMRGGYYPIVYDSRLSWRQQELDETASITELYGGAYTRVSTRHGHTIERTNSGGKAIKLDLGVMTNHIVNVIHDLTHRRAILDVDRLVTDDAVREAIEQTAGKEMYGQLRPWLKSIAADFRPHMTVVEGMLNHLRGGATVVSMGVKITTALVQPLGYFQSLELLGPKYSAIGLRDVYAKGNPIKSLTNAKEFAFERSEQIRNRMTTFDRDIRDQFKRMTETGKTAPVRRSFFFLTGLLDMSVALPTWIGAYRKAMDGDAQGIQAGDEKAAIDYADSILRKSQSAGGAKDLAGIQQGHPLLKMFTTFYSYFNVLFNLLARRFQMMNWRRPADYPRFVASMLTLWFMPAVLSEIVAGRGPDDDEDWDEYMKRTASLWATYPLQSVVFVRDVVNAAGPWGYDGPPALEAITKTGETLALPAKILDEDAELTRGDLRDALLAGSYWGHLPGRQMWITGSYLYDWSTGEEDPDDLAQFMEGLAFARQQ